MVNAQTLTLIRVFFLIFVVAQVHNFFSTGLTLTFYGEIWLEFFFLTRKEPAVYSGCYNFILYLKSRMCSVTNHSDLQ